MSLHVRIVVCLVWIASGALAEETTLRNDVTLEQQLRGVSPAYLVEQANQRGDASRGALVFFKSPAGCVRCHSVGDQPSPLGPNLSSLDPEMSDVEIIESLLYPSRRIAPAYQTHRVLTTDGDVLVGLIRSQNDSAMVLELASEVGKQRTVDPEDVEQIVASSTSLMPDGLVASLDDLRQFFDLARYLLELKQGGRERAEQLMPTDAQLTVKDDSVNLDHAGIIKRLRTSDFRAGERIYHGYCFNCHGKDGNTPSLPTARAFGTQRLKFGADPYRMFMTLTKGNGLMAPMSHLTPKERYQVVHYIREAFMKGRNEDYQPVDAAYLDELPVGKDDGTRIETPPRDRGPALASQLGREVASALTIDLSGISISYDLHSMDQAGIWSGGFLDLSETQHYRPRGEGTANPQGSPVAGLEGWAWGHDGDLDYPREGLNPRGPLPRSWMQYRGHSIYQDSVVLRYAIDRREILEMPRGDSLGMGSDSSGSDSSGSDSVGMVRHRMQIGPGPALILSVAKSDATKPNRLPSPYLMMVGKRNAVAAAVLGDRDGMEWKFDAKGRLVLSIPADTESREIEIIRAAGIGNASDFQTQIESESERPLTRDLDQMIAGGPSLWPEATTTTGYLGLQQGAYTLDTLTIPDENPFNSWMRTSGIDFFDDGRMVVSTYGGDVWIVSGVDESLMRLGWRRFASGLYEPMGVKVVDGQVCVTCKDRLVRLHDRNRDGCADFYESLSADEDVSPNFHAFNFDLQVDRDGNFYYAKSGHGGDSAVPGQVVKISPDGQQRSIFSTGFRTPNGMGVLPDGRVTASDNQGQWMPASKINLLRPGGFYGWVQTYSIPGMWEPGGGKIDVKKVVPPTSFDQPIIWMPQVVDNSSGGQLFVDDDRFGPLSGRLFHTSFGKGWMFYLMTQDVEEATQAAIIKLPFDFRTGIMRAAVNPADGQVYAAGLQGWNGGGRLGLKENGVQRLRYTGKPFRMVKDCRVTTEGLRIEFNFALDVESAKQRESWDITQWNYHWRAAYGSDKYSPATDQKGVDPLEIRRIDVDDDGYGVTLIAPDLRPVNQIHIVLRLDDRSGKRFEEEIYWTVNALPRRE